MDLAEIIAEANTSSAAFPRRLEARLRLAERLNLEYNIFIRSFLSVDNLTHICKKLENTKKGSSLYGSTFAVKDNFQVKRQPLTMGLARAVIERSEKHADLVHKLIKLGSTLIASTNMDPAAIGHLGDNPFYGRVHNPNLPGLISGGSSGGSAAAVAAGLCDFSLGSDHGGSIRIPATACGVVGLKVSPDILPRQGILLIDNQLDCPGIFAANLADLILLMDALSPQPEQNKASLPHFIIPSKKELGEMDDRVAKGFSLSVEQLRLSFVVQEVDFDLGFESAIKARKDLIAARFASLTSRLSIPASSLPDAGQALLLLSQSIRAERIDTAAEVQVAIQERCQSILEKNCYILTPSLPVAVPSWRKEGQRTLPHHDLARFMPLANVASLPALSLPIASQSDNAPFSLQLIGASGRDRELLETAKLIELR